MKVLHLSSERSWRGGEQQIAYLIEHSINKGIECFVACKKDSDFEDYCKRTNIPYFGVGFKNELDLFTAIELKNICNRKNIDIIHAHSSHSHAMAVWSVLLGNKSRFFLHRRVDFPMKNNFFSSFKFNFTRIEKVICISKKIEEIMRKDLKVPDKCLTVSSGIDLERFKNSKDNGELRKSLQIPDTAPIIGNISAIADHKDYFTFVDVADQVISSNPNAYFVLIGDGPLYAEISAYISTKKHKSHIIMTGFRADIPEIIKELNIFLITSKTEGLGTTILDTFANRIPVVATRAGGIPEAVVHEQTGLLAEVKDVKQLAINIQRLLKDKNLVEHLTTAAYEHLLAHFTKEKMAEGVIESYKN